MLAHAREGLPYEVCGLLVASGKKCKVVRGRNIDAKPRENFTLDPDCWLDVQDGEDVIGIYHSHPVTCAAPSMHDLVMCEATMLPWHIVNPETEEHQVVYPKGYTAPYEGRPYVHGVLDCYAVCRDWYVREWGLQMPEVERKDGWWLTGQNLYLDHLKVAGFVVMPEGTEHAVGDGLLEFGVKRAEALEESFHPIPPPSHSPKVIGR